MSLNDRIFVLREDVDYPEGCNIVEIDGSGDERANPKYPKIIVGLTPMEVASNGTDVVTVDITIRDYNSSNPFEGTLDLEDSTTADESRFEFSTSGFIRLNADGSPRIQVWEDASHLYEITDQIFAVDGNKVRLSSDFRSQYADPANPADRGLIYQTVYYRIDTGPTASISVGSQTEEWWELNPDGTSRIVNPTDNGQVGGNFYYDLACTRIISDNEILLPVSLNQRVDTTVYFRPERESYGVAIINVAYGGGEAKVELVVTSAIASAYDAELTADPSSVQIGEKSLVTLWLSQGGSVINDVNVNFVVFGDTSSNDMGSLENSVAITQPMLDQVDYVRSTEGYKISVSRPITLIKGIYLEPQLAGDNPDAWFWNSDLPMVVDGTSIELNAGNVLPYAELNLKVVYDTGGYCSCVYVAPPSIPIPNGSEDPTITATVIAKYLGTSKSVDIEVTPANSMVTNGLSISAESPVAPLAHSTVRVWHNLGVDYNGRVVTLSYWPAGFGSGPGTVTLGVLNIVDEEVQSASNTELTVEYPIDSGVLPTVTLYNEATGNYDPYLALAVHDINGITLADALPMGQMDVKVSYRAISIAEFEFAAPAQEMNIYIGAELTTGLVTERVNCKIQVDLEAANGLNLSLDPEHSSLPYEDEQTHLQVYTTNIVVSSSYYDDVSGADATGRVVSLLLTPTGCGSLPGSCVLGTKTMQEVDVSPSSLRKISAKYIIKSTPTVTIQYNSQVRPVASYAGNEITLVSDLPISLPRVQLDYTAGAITDVEYNATGAYAAATAAGSVSLDVEDTSAIVYIGGKMTIPEVGVGYANCEITLNDPLADAGVEIEATESTIYKPLEDEDTNAGWRTDEEEANTETYPQESTVTVTLTIGGAIAPAGTEYTLYVFSNGLEPADDSYDGTVKTGGTVNGSVRTVGDEGTDSFILNARDMAIDTYIFKAVFSQASADTSVTVEERTSDVTYLTYDIPVATIVGWRKAIPLEYDIYGRLANQGGYEFCSSNASIRHYGGLILADAFAGVDASPEGQTAADTSQYLLIEFNLPQWLDFADIESVSVSGATVIQPILRWGLDDGEISSGYASSGGGVGGLSPGIFAIKWAYEFNYNEFTVAIKEYMPEGSETEGEGVYGSTVTIGTSSHWTPYTDWSKTTDNDGNATFYEIPPGTYPIFISSPNHKDNADADIWAGAVQSIGVQDNIDSNDTVTVPPRTTRPYILKDTEWSIEVTATVKQRSKYDALAVMGGWSPDASENISVTVR